MDKPKEEKGRPGLTEIMKNIFKRVEDEKHKDHRTPTGYSRMHHRHSRS